MIQKLPKNREQVFYKSLFGKKFKLLISPQGEEWAFDLRKTEEGLFNLKFGAIEFFDTRLEASKALEQYDEFKDN